MRLEGRTAIITGGGQGIGRGIALQFVREGARVVIAQRTAEKLERTQAEIEDLGGQVLAVPTDVGHEDQIENLIRATRDHFGGLDILVNNAGVGLGVPVEDVTLEQYSRLMDTNIKGMYFGCRYAVPLLKERGGGAIINISSVHGVEGAPRNTLYAATKGGIIGCTRALAAELAPAAIRVNAISPGAIQIADPIERMSQRIKPEFRAEFIRLFKDKIESSRKYYQPLEMIGMPEDIAYCAVYLASEEARFVTGQNITVDGGLTTYLAGFASEAARAQQTISWEEVRDWIRAHKVEGAPL